MASTTVGKHCATCGKSDAAGVDLQRCSRCKLVEYCGKDCQKADWKKHKEACKSGQTSATEAPRAEKRWTTEDLLPPGRKCATCGAIESQAAPLRRCNVCEEALYCNRKCQRADWKMHKLVCSTIAKAKSGMERIQEGAQGRSEAPNAGRLQCAVKKPFTQLRDRTWLHNRPEEDVFMLVIDSYRMRMSDAMAYASTDGLRDYIKKMERDNWLPSWWSAKKEERCVEFALDTRNWSNIRKRITNRDIVERYGDDMMVGQMRMFAEFVYKKSVLPSPVSAEKTVQYMSDQENGIEYPYEDLL